MVFSGKIINKSNNLNNSAEKRIGGWGEGERGGQGDKEAGEINGILTIDY